MVTRSGRGRGVAAPGGAQKRGRARGRRSGEEARRAILEIAARRLLAGGPEAVRLKEIAADAGLSHPTILHHFGSREGLSEALVKHTMQRLQESLMAVFSQASVQRSFSDRVERSAHMAELTVRTLREQGLARLIAWLVLSGEDIGSQLRGVFSALPQVMHAARVERRRTEGRSIPPLEDTLFGATMVMITLFGEVLIGPSVRAAVGFDEERTVGPRFLRWMAGAWEAYEPPATPEPPPGGRRRGTGRR